MVETFDRRKVSFVSVTQLINTSTSMGRLMLNVLLSFAQFEREIISERTRDKIAAARRKGKWSGGMPLLGYDVDPRGSKLIVNEDEAIKVRTIFELYLQHQSLIATIAELDRRGWINKRWITRKGTERSGRPFNKDSLHCLLTNVTYLGKLRYKSASCAASAAPRAWPRTATASPTNCRSLGRPSSTLCPTTNHKEPRTMADLSGFDANQVEPSNDLDPVPAGKYLAVITESEMAPNKAGTGHYLKLTFQIIEGAFKNRLLWTRLNLDNPNATAVQIARGELSAICRAVGVLAPSDSVELHNLPLVIHVKCKIRPIR
jgi:hypothetical protein